MSARSHAASSTALTGAPGKNWLFFGHQRRDHDFFYESELNALKVAGVLTRLSLAWSRDGAEKFYVQDRMRELGTELFAWLEQGAHLAVCGDAKRMAKDVEDTLLRIAMEQGGRDAVGARACKAWPSTAAARPRSTMARARRTNGKSAAARPP